MEEKRTNLVVIDDEPALLELYENLLSDDFQITTFDHPEKFLAELEKSSSTPDLLITDLKMPSMTGLEMIKVAHDRNHFFPFILLTGFLDKKTAVDAIDLGAFRLLEKPVDFGILRETIDHLMLEHDVVANRREIRNLTSQLRELYSGIRLLFEQYIPSEILDRMIVETDSHGGIKKKVSFEVILEELEERLERLLDTEKVYETIKKVQRRVNF